MMRNWESNLRKSTTKRWTMQKWLRIKFMISSSTMLRKCKKIWLKGSWSNDRFRKILSEKDKRNELKLKLIKSWLKIKRKQMKISWDWMNFKDKKSWRRSEKLQSLPNKRINLKNLEEIKKIKSFEKNKLKDKDLLTDK